MSIAHRLTAYLALVGCDASMNDQYCILVDAADECPTGADAEVRIVGTETCEDPVRKITAVGELTDRHAWAPDTGMENQDMDECCYEVHSRVKPGESCVIGRPFGVVAAVAEGRGWTERVEPDLDGLSDADRAALAAMWTEIGLLEHASVASFARFALELMAHGAPSALVDAAHAAARDEVRHATSALALASAFAGRDVAPGPLPVPSFAVSSLAELGAATVREGCIGETLAVVIAAHQLAAATDPAVRAALERIVVDETRHAELAWATVRWALSVGGDDVRAAVRAAFEAAVAPEPSWPDGAVPSHGLVAHARLRAAAADALNRVVVPAAEVLSTS